MERWPATALVNISPALNGMVVLRGTITFMSPPKVSIPSESGVTSSSTTSRSAPSKIAACKVAPFATASSGFCVVLGVLPNISATSARTTGIRVEPPTSTTSCNSSARRPASASARKQRIRVRSRIGRASFSSSSRVITNTCD